jgi:hypothetical protein
LNGWGRTHGRQLASKRRLCWYGVRDWGGRALPANPEHLALEAEIRLEVPSASTNRRKPYEENRARPYGGKAALGFCQSSGMVARIGDAAGELGTGADCQLVVHP